jgi:hypothetical protein
VCLLGEFEAYLLMGGHVVVASELEFRDIGECGIVTVVDGIDLTTFAAAAWKASAPNRFESSLECCRVGNARRWSTTARSSRDGPYE